MHRFATILFVFTSMLTQQGLAHEYYLMPETFSPKSGQEINVLHRLGEKFKGNELPYIDRWNVRSEVWENGAMTSVRGTDGDRPALKVTGSKKGLMTVVHQSNIDFLTFKTWEKFQKYTLKEGLGHALADSETGKKPKIGLKEAYARFAKTLVYVDGDKTSVDFPVGLKIELVALANPLALKADQKMPVQVLYQGKPLENALIKVFVGVGNEFTHKIFSNKDGKAEIPADGPGPYLLNAIFMDEPESEEAIEKGAHWESYWASLTFERGQ